ncbi:MAG: pyridoxal phosphate-dependent aminotransferase [Firmicutes bacterium]|jgi:cystathionine beta-lyase|nr:pyridoxal phosphate-dependent aminotransferase [Bacillota bacterium]
MYNLEKIVNRQNSSSVKYEEMVLKFGSNDMLPFWVADMDIKCPDFMIESLVKRAEHGVFGYTKRMPEFYNSVINWLDTRHEVKVKREELEYGPGVVFLLNMMIRNETKVGDQIIIQTPVYYPFKSVVEGNERVVLDNKLVNNNGRYEMNFDELEKMAKDPKTTMMLLCSPHNPVGRVWTMEELQRVADICLENDVLLISDEIHFDLVYKGNKHISVARLGDKYNKSSVVCTAPSKTFNIAGLHTSYCIIRDEEIMTRYRNELGLMDLNRSNCFSREITQTVYEMGADYVDNLVDFLEGNRDYTYDFIKENIPGIEPYKIEATYLLWMDCKGLGLSKDQIDDLFFKEAKIALDSGHWFGDNGEGFMRINLACSREMLAEGLDRLKDAVAAL